MDPPVPHPPMGALSAPKGSSTSRRSSQSSRSAAGAGASGGGGAGGAASGTAAGMLGSGDKGVSTVLIEAGAQRVFVTHSRLFGFAHRDLASLRHPLTPFRLAAADAEKPRNPMGRPALTNPSTLRLERVAEAAMPSATNATFRMEQERWAHVGQMLDGVLIEKDLAARRGAMVHSPALWRQAETIWIRCGAMQKEGMDFAAYEDLHRNAYTHLLQIREAPPTALQDVMNRGIMKDWAHDSEGAPLLPFSRFYVSMLELADNWTSSCEQDQYVAFLADLLPTCCPAVQPPPQSAVSDDPPQTWEEKTEWLKVTAMKMTRQPLISSRRTLRHTTEYYASLVDTSPPRRHQRHASLATSLTLGDNVKPSLRKPRAGEEAAGARADAEAVPDIRSAASSVEPEASEESYSMQSYAQAREDAAGSVAELPH